MKEFWMDNSKIIGKSLLNQFGAAFFGIMLFFAAYSLKHIIWLPLLASVIAIVFYLYLIYENMWEIGGQDRIKFDGGRAAKTPWKGLLISLMANLPNIILAVIINVSELLIFSTTGFAGKINTIGRAIALLWEGMYMGVIKTYSPHNPIIYILIIFPAIFVSALAYYLGFSNIRIFGGKTK